METERELKLVWEPLRIGATTVKHRVMATGHTQLYGKDETISNRHVAYYRERARGGAALLVLEQQAVHPVGMAYHAGCIAFDPKVIPWYRKLADAVHEFGCKQFVQLFACGSQGRGTMHMDRWHPLWAASAIPSIIYNEIPLVMEQEHIDEIVSGFGISARNAQEAGIDGVEIHAAHSQLVGEFLSPGFNKRTDGYGGSVRNRCRFLLEVGEEVRRRVGADFTVGVRLSFDEFLGEAGITGEETEAQLEVLAGSGLFDFFNISGGGYHTLHVAVAPMGSMPEGFMVPFAKRAKAVVGERAKVFVVGRILDLRKAEEILAEGAADMVALTRAQIADPFLVNKVREGRERELTKCVGVNFCVERLIDNREVTCALNPVTGRELYWGDGTLQPVNGSAKRILVVGGGPAGMRAAGIAAKRGHEVVLFEREELGGHFNLLSRLPTREGWGIAVDNLTRLVEDAGVEVSQGTDATAGMLEDEAADAVVVATGSTWDKTGFSQARPDRPGIPGAEAEHVLDAGDAIRRAIADPHSLGKRVLIVDDTGAYPAFGLAELLADAGVSVELISPQLLLGEDLLKSLDMTHVFPRLVAKGVRMQAQRFVERIEAGSAEVYDIWGGGRRVVEADTVVLVMTRTPNDRLYHELRGRLPEVHRVGDAVAPRRAAAVIYEGEKLGREI